MTWKPAIPNDRPGIGRRGRFAGSWFPRRGEMLRQPLVAWRKNVTILKFRMSGPWHPSNRSVTLGAGDTRKDALER